MSECSEKYQFELCSKYDREYEFDVILGLVVPCRKLRWICCKHAIMSRDKLKHQVSEQFLSCDQFTLSRGITFRSHWRLHNTMTGKQVEMYF